MFLEAVAEMETAATLSGRIADYLGGLGHADAQAGRTADARKVLDELTARSTQRYVSWRDIAVIEAGLGEKDEAFAALDKAYALRDSGIVFLKVDPLFDPLRSDLASRTYSVASAYLNKKSVAPSVHCVPATFCHSDQREESARRGDKPLPTTLPPDI